MGTFSTLRVKIGTILCADVVHFAYFTHLSALQRLRRHFGAFLPLRRNLGAKKGLPSQVSRKRIIEDFDPQICTLRGPV